MQSSMLFLYDRNICLLTLISDSLRTIWLGYKTYNIICVDSMQYMQNLDKNIKFIVYLYISEM